MSVFCVCLERASERGSRREFGFGDAHASVPPVAPLRKFIYINFDTNIIKNIILTVHLGYAMGRHTDPFTLELIEWLQRKGENFGFMSETEFPIGGNYFIDLVWRFDNNLDPIVTFEIETRNTNTVFKNTCKIFASRQSVVKRPYQHFSIVCKSRLSDGQIEGLHFFLDHYNISLYQNIFNEPELMKKLENELNEYDFMKHDSELINSFRSNGLLGISDIDYALHQYGNELPFMFESDIVRREETHPYKDIRKTTYYVRNRIRKIKKENDLNKKDLESLLKIIRLSENINAKENILLNNGICPKCGGNLTQKQIYHGGSELNPEPYAITYIDGCEDCDFELNRETIDI